MSVLRTVFVCEACRLRSRLISQILATFRSAPCILIQSRWPQIHSAKSLIEPQLLADKVNLHPYAHGWATRHCYVQAVQALTAIFFASQPFYVAAMKWQDVNQVSFVWLCQKTINLILCSPKSIHVNPCECRYLQRNTPKVALLAQHFCSYLLLYLFLCAYFLVQANLVDVSRPVLGDAVREWYSWNTN